MNFRLKYGLFWRGKRPSLADLDRLADAAIAILFVIALLCLIGLLEARDRALDAEIASRKTTQSFADFLNGGTLVNDTMTFAAKCSTLVEVTQ